MKEFKFNSKKHKDQIREVFVQDPYFTAAGLFFGFPECCVDGFIKDYNTAVKIKHPEAPFMGTGFIPCSCCGDEAASHWSKFKETIEQRRISTLPFPHEGNSNELYRFFCKLTDSLGYDFALISKMYSDDEELKDVVKEELELVNGKNIIHNQFLAQFKDNKSIEANEIVNFCKDNKKFDDKIVKTAIKPLIQAMKKAKSHKSYSEHQKMEEKRTEETIKDALYVMIRDPQIEMSNDALKDIVNDVCEILYPYYHARASELAVTKRLKIK